MDERDLLFQAGDRDALLKSMSQAVNIASHEGEFEVAGIISTLHGLLLGKWQNNEVDDLVSLLLMASAISQKELEKAGMG